MWRKAMVYLGLGDDDEYDDYENGYDAMDQSERPAPRDRYADVQRQAPAAPPSPSTGGTSLGAVTPIPGSEESSAIGAVRPLNAEGMGDAHSTGQTIVPSGSNPAVRPRPQVVRPIVSSDARPFVVVPVSFNQAQEVADKFKGGQPVVINLQDGDRELSRRLIDFASGLCYGLGGQMERLASQVYLVTPAGAEVGEDERRRLRNRNFDA